MTDGNVIQYPGKHDVMLGRGGESNYHSGNISFRHMVFSFKEVSDTWLTPAAPAAPAIVIVEYPVKVGT